MSAWLDHVTRWKDCTACPLCQQRDRICLARGTVPCDVLFVGEAPGASEDAIGQPFTGPAGRHLDQIIERSLPPTTTYALTNLVCCFPHEAKTAGINEPEDAEILACEPRLIEFVNIAQPKLIVCVGALAARWISPDAGVPCLNIVHPAAILRMPLAQQQMATQKCIVQLRNAVEDVVLSGAGPKFTQWGNSHAQVKSPREQLRAAYNDANIPF